MKTNPSAKLRPVCVRGVTLDKDDEERICSTKCEVNAAEIAP